MIQAKLAGTKKKSLTTYTEEKGGCGNELSQIKKLSERMRFVNFKSTVLT